MADHVLWCDKGWQPVFFGFCPSEKAWKREMKRMGCPEEPYPTTDARMTSFESNGKVTCIVTVADGSEDRHSATEVIGIIVHEATHIWKEVRKAMGEKDPSIEFEAYSMQAIVQGLLSAWGQTRGKPKEAVNGA